MKNIIYYFSGTGNSLYAAKKIAESLGGTEVNAVAVHSEACKNTDYETIGIIFPVYMYNPPKIVVRFLANLSSNITNAPYVYVIAVNGGDPGLALKKASEIIGRSYVNASFDLRMPENYLPYWNSKTEEKNKTMMQNAEKKIENISEQIKLRNSVNEFKMHLFKYYFIPGLLYSMGYKYLNFMDKNFYADSQCNSCGLCAVVCPVVNIEMTDTSNGKKPIWKKKCEQCYACINYCPQKSIQYGKKTLKVGRYHHPEITLKMLNKDV